MNVKKWLTEEEAKKYSDGFNMATFESLAACRALLKKHEYSASGFMPGEDPYPLCPECRYDEHDGHAPDCAIATALKGVGESEI